MMMSLIKASGHKYKKLKVRKNVHVNKSILLVLLIFYIFADIVPYDFYNNCIMRCWYILQAMGNVGIRIGQLYREAPVIEMSEKLKKNASWGHRLSKIKVGKSQIKLVWRNNIKIITKNVFLKPFSIFLVHVMNLVNFLLCLRSTSVKCLGTLTVRRDCSSLSWFSVKLPLYPWLRISAGTQCSIFYLIVIQASTYMM